MKRQYISPNNNMHISMKRPKNGLEHKYVNLNSEMALVPF